MTREEGDALAAALRRLSPDERPAWMAEAERLVRVVEAYRGDRTQAPAQPCHRRVRLRPRGISALPAGALDRPSSRQQGAAPGAAPFAAHARPVGQALPA